MFMSPCVLFHFFTVELFVNFISVKGAIHMKGVTTAAVTTTLLLSLDISF